MSNLSIRWLLALSGFVGGCSGIASRTVEENSAGAGAASGSGGADASFMEGGRGGALTKGGGKGFGGTANGGKVGGGFGADAGESGASAGAPQLDCPPSPNPTPLHALSVSQYAGAIEALTNTPVTAQLTPGEAVLDPFVFSLRVDRDNLQSLLFEAERQGAAPGALKLLTCDLAQALSGNCAHDFVSQFVARAFRRPLTAAETERYVSLFKAGSGNGDVAGGVSLVVQAALLSPLFLYKVYLGDAVERQGVWAPLTSTELAARLALSFGDGIADSARWNLTAGDPPDNVWLAGESARLLQTPQFVLAAQRHYAAWLGLDELPARRADLSQAVVDSMRGQGDLFIEDFLATSDSSLSKLLLTHDTFLDPLLAPRYGVPAAGPGFAKVTVDPARYFGILTLGGVLARYTNPSQRGSFVRTRLLCTNIPPPPPGPSPTVTVAPSQTRRDAWMQTTTLQPTCSACHARMDPIGFAFENFDADGVSHSTENGLPIDTSGELTGAGTGDGAFGSLGELAQLLSQSDTLADCIVRIWLGYVLERPLTSSDDCSVQQVKQAFLASGKNIRGLLEAIPQTALFRFRDGYPVAAVPEPMLALPSVQTQAERRKLLLDFSIAETQWLREMVPPEDRPVLENHLGALRDLQIQLSQVSPSLPPP